MSGTVTLKGDFNLADELTGKQRRESLQNQYEKRKTDGCSVVKYVKENKPCLCSKIRGWNLEQAKYSVIQ